VEVETTGDRRSDVAVWEMAGQGVFVKEVQAAVLEGRADLAVHSAKDLPSTSSSDLVLAAVPERGEARDALVGSRLDDLGAGALVATGSVRRRAQLAWLRPDLAFTGLRGNIATRLTKIPPGGAVVVAAAALERLGLSARAAEVLDTTMILPQVGQGALAVECRSNDDRVFALAAAIEHPASRSAVDAERGFLARLGAGCDLPVGAHATVDQSTVWLEAMVASRDGRLVLRSARSGPAVGAAGVGAELAEELLARGGRDVLGMVA
jgi:hydroxymethylbilane synthase